MLASGFRTPGRWLAGVNISRTIQSASPPVAGSARDQNEIQQSRGNHELPRSPRGSHIALLVRRV